MSRLALGALLVATLLVSVADARSYAWLGVRIRDLSEQEMEELAAKHGIREGFGVFITDVLESTPAARAGLRSGDVVVAVGTRPVVDTRMLQHVIGEAGPDSDVKVTVLRADGRRQIAVRLVAMPKPVAGERVAAEYGFVLRDPDTAAERAAASSVGTGPASVVAVLRGSAADRAGLEVGDVIVAIEQLPAPSRDAAREALADATPERPLHLVVRRGEREMPVTVPAP